MLLPLIWMKDYLNIDKDSKEIADKVTLSGSHVESVMDLSEGLDKIVTAKILKITKHPNADKLSIVTLDYGSKTIEIITGARNMNEEDSVVFAQVGAKLPNGLEIKPIDLMGIESPGMLCSYEELGFSKNVVPKNSQDGIIILEDTKPGTPIVDVLQLEEPVIEFEITPNRPDCLSILGMSREVAATFRKRVNPPKSVIKNEEGDIGDYFDGVNINSNDCYRYIGRVVKDVKIKNSPQWIVNRLMQAGIRPINNIVDITNFVLLELGQPIHAFDLETLKSKVINVGKPDNNFNFTTLDKEKRELTKDDLIIYDGDNPVAIAGVMGGLDSDVKDSTTRIFIESASFSPDCVRNTSKRLNLRTEASMRFEKEVPTMLASLAMDRVCNLIEQTNSGVVVKGEYDVVNKEVQEESFEFDYHRINEILGTNLTIDEIVDYLEDLEFVTEVKGDFIKITVPYFRTDIHIVEDVAEEIGRLYGFHNIEPKPLVGGLLSGNKSYQRQVEDRVKTILYGCGIYEVMTYSFISKKSYDKAFVSYNAEESIELLNPLGEDFSVMRTTTLTNLLDIMEKNSKNKVENLKIYELGNTFYKDQDGKLKEKKKIGLGMYGNVDFYNLKEVVETLLKELGLSEIEFESVSKDKTLHPGRAAKVIVAGKEIGQIGEISFDVAKNYDFIYRVYIGELDFESILPHVIKNPKFIEISKFPTIERDIAIVLSKDVETSVVEKIMLEKGGKLLRNVELFDVYMGEHIEEGKKSSAYNLKFQGEDRTLREEEVNELMDEIVSSLEEELDAHLRS
ncbi:phenylalanine--tRNA ligase subunit beta [Lagierella sp.]|uniref:phenylalanine--tRNA ligase subunit beta n=1 Tax=Lagierella sp. TaxID=2849657 RepID=UPI002624E7B1|nr:phenylalanine--tRNA ligase subunit beta [Lagierella sp.]